MLFNSLAFGIFFAICFAVYALLPHRARKAWLLLASYTFYASWDWRFLGRTHISGPKNQRDRDTAQYWCG